MMTLHMLAALGLTVSLMVAEPGDELFSCVGHAFLRVEDPATKSDYAFSYESESLRGRTLSFFAGNVKMGMFAVPTAKYLKDYAQEGRGVRQYRLDLPDDVLRRLWEILDRKEKEGINLPFDYIKRGCAFALLGFIREALGDRELDTSGIPELCGRTKRDRFSEAVTWNRPWLRIFLHMLFGAAADRVEGPCEVVAAPRDLLLLLRRAKVNGKPVISDAGREVLVNTRTESAKPFVTPFGVACVLAALAVACCVRGVRWLGWLLLGLQTALGLFFTYLAVSDLPATERQLLFVPFNPLPLLLWRWRRFWAWPFAALLVAWIGFVALWPHVLTDTAFVVLAAGYALFFACAGRPGGGLQPIFLKIQQEKERQEKERMAE